MDTKANSYTYQTDGPAIMILQNGVFHGTLENQKETIQHLNELQEKIDSLEDQLAPSHK